MTSIRVRTAVSSSTTSCNLLLHYGFLAYACSAFRIQYVGNVLPSPPSCTAFAVNDLSRSL